jgi:hypothetical protein
MKSDSCHCGLDPQSLENQVFFFYEIAGQARNDRLFSQPRTNKGFYHRI